MATLPAVLLDDLRARFGERCTTGEAVRRQRST
jgi:hypothetical protein